MSSLFVLVIITVLIVGGVVTLSKIDVNEDMGKFSYIAIGLVVVVMLALVLAGAGDPNDSIVGL